MKHTDIGVNTRFNECTLNASIENAIAIVEESIGNIKSRMLRTEDKAELFRKKGIDGIEIDT